MVRPETEVPIAEKKMLDFSPAFIARGVIAKLTRMIGNLKDERDNLPLLGFRGANDERSRLAGENRIVGTGPMHAGAASPNP